MLPSDIFRSDTVAEDASVCSTPAIFVPACLIIYEWHSLRNNQLACSKSHIIHELRCLANSSPMMMPSRRHHDADTWPTVVTRGMA